jgi:hypothetical protein
MSGNTKRNNKMFSLVVKLLGREANYFHVALRSRMVDTPPYVFMAY